MTSLSLPEKKPVNDIRKIIDALLPFAKKINCAGHKKLVHHCGKNNFCYIVLEGEITIRRNIDALVLFTIQAPIITGLTTVLLPTTEGFYIRTEEKCNIYMIDSAEAEIIIAEKNLWRSLSIILSYIIYHHIAHSNIMIAQSASTIILQQINKLMNEPEKVRLNITAVRYILERTLLSRSHTMKVISNLKSEGKISIKNGILISVEKHLI